MASQRSLSETEMRLLNQVCEAINATSEDQKDLLKSFVCNELGSEWTSLVSLMQSSGPLSILSDDELKYLTVFYSTNRNDEYGQTHDGPSIFSQVDHLLSRKTIDHNMVKAAIHDIVQYNNVLEKLTVKYKDYVRRSIASIQRSPETDTGASAVDQKISALSLRRDMLKKEIHKLEGRVESHRSRLDGVTQAKANAGKAGGDTDDENPKAVALNQVLETTFPSYDYILSKLNALHGELGHDAVEDDKVFHIARRHASQIVLSLATKCRASLDTVFLQASLSYSRHAPSASNGVRSTKEERDAVYAEIQSLWDEMVPLAHMVVEKEFLNPILKLIEACSERQGGQDAVVYAYTSSMLRFMNERLRLLLERIKMLVYHHQILLNAFAHIASEIHSQPSWSLGDAKVRSVQDKENGKAKHRTLLDTIRRKMELYGAIPIEVDKQSQQLQKVTPRMQADKLDRYVVSRQRKGDELARNVHDFFERTTKTELTDAELGAQLLLDSVIADSTAGFQTGGRVYDDQQVEDSVATMKTQAEEIQTVFGQLREGTGAPSSAPEFVAYAYSKVTKQPAHKDGEDPSRLDDQRQCGQFAALIRKWGDSADFTN
ncbi:hypothetical protein F5Y05DRAFT_407669 [Hypoxylon sp. FL0543]|nr:hypothetical protein F5Y05DRAFT_407669 [Hypoxylon sp. FL0543]